MVHCIEICVIANPRSDWILVTFDRNTDLKIYYSIFDEYTSETTN